MSAADPPRPARLDLLIGGLARSGTTLVQRLVGELAGVRVAPETHFWRHAARLDAAHPVPLARSAAADAVAHLAGLPSTDLLEVDVEDVVARLPEQSHLWELYAALCSSLVGLGGPGTLVAEKTPDHLLWAEQLVDAVPRLRVVAVVRDPREVLRSQREVPWGLENAAALGQKWLGHARVADDLSRLHPDRVLVARYEDVVRDPTAFQRDVAALLGLRFAVDDADGPAFHDDEWWRVEATEAVRSDGDRWQEELDEADIAAVEHAATVQLERWGYPRVATRVDPAPADEARCRSLRNAAARIRATQLPVTAATTRRR